MWFFSFNILNILPHSFFAYIVSSKKSTVVILRPIYLQVRCFPLWLLWRFLVFCSSNLRCIGGVFWTYLFYVVFSEISGLEVSWLLLILENFLLLITSNISSIPFFFLFYPSDIFQNCPTVHGYHVSFFHFISLNSVWKVSIATSSSFMILSLVVHSLLISISKIFFIYVTVFFVVVHHCIIYYSKNLRLRYHNKEIIP